MAAHGITAPQVVSGRFLVPPLTHRLVGRPPHGAMTVAYARLCLSFVGAICLRQGTVGLGDFTAAALTDPETLALAARLAVVEDDNPDPNALDPIRVELTLTDGRTLASDVADVLGSPANPLSVEAARAKFTACGAPAALWDAVMRLETVPDIARLPL